MQMSLHSPPAGRLCAFLTLDERYDTLLKKFHLPSSTMTPFKQFLTLSMELFDSADWASSQTTPDFTNFNRWSQSRRTALAN
jgi:hypothetical protein